jgi:hypothetical protein
MNGQIKEHKTLHKIIAEDIGDLLHKFKALDLRLDALETMFPKDEKPSLNADCKMCQAGQPTPPETLQQLRESVPDSITDKIMDEYGKHSEDTRSLREFAQDVVLLIRSDTDTVSVAREVAEKWTEFAEKEKINDGKEDEDNRLFDALRKALRKDGTNG